MWKKSVCENKLCGNVNVKKNVSHVNDNLKKLLI